MMTINVIVDFDDNDDYDDGHYDNYDINIYILAAPANFCIKILVKLKLRTGDSTLILIF